ncbi:MAG TPA: hypothetical protein VK607_08355 [Kofleriaceae bacterium]|nr:hypothetical protein [Kofleriaceae bacterium]
MRIWKLVVLLAGVAGVIGFFTPLIDYRSSDGKLTGDASAFQIARGVDSGGDLRAQAESLGVSRADSERLARAFTKGIQAYAGAVVACFVPAGLLAALGLLLMLRDRMGRFSGLCAIVLGGACGAVFARFWQADQLSQDLRASLGLGVYLLLAAGLGGVLAGLGALVNPDRGH